MKSFTLRARTAKEHDEDFGRLKNRKYGLKSGRVASEPERDYFKNINYYEGGKKLRTEQILSTRTDLKFEAQSVNSKVLRWHRSRVPTDPR